MFKVRTLDFIEAVDAAGELASEGERGLADKLRRQIHYVTLSAERVDVLKDAVVNKKKRPRSDEPDESTNEA